MTRRKKPARNQNLRRFAPCLPIAALEHESSQASDSSRAWRAFRDNEELQRAHRISRDEIQMLSETSLMGDARSADDFLFVLKVLRSTLKA